MHPLTGKNMVVIGGSRGVGRRIVESAVQNGAKVLAVARQEAPLRQLAQEVPGVEVLSIDATDEVAPSRVFDVLRPDILVLCAGAFPRRADPPAELAGVRRQLGDGRQNRVSLLEDGVVPASASRLLGDSDLKRRCSRRIAELGRIRRSQTHADLHRKLQSEGIGSTGPRLAIHGACAAHDAGHRTRKACGRRLFPVSWDI